MKPRILITGSAGFIGSNIVQKLINQGYEIWGIDNYSDYYSPSMKFAREIDLGLKETTRNVDLSDFENLKAVFELVKPNIVINLAAQGGVRASRINPMPYLQANQVGFFNLISLAREYEVSKFIYASSSSVYGDTTPAPFIESANLPAPKSLYALSKMSNEIIAENFDSPKMTKVGLRFFTVYGPWGRPDMAMFRILASCILEREFVLTASPTVKRDFTFIEDLSEVVAHMISSELGFSGHQVLNVAGGKPYSLSNLFAILASMSLPLKIREARPDTLDVKLTHGSIEKLNSFGLPVPSSSLAFGVEETFKWISKVNLSNLSEWYDYHS